MSVTADIWESWRAPGRVVRRLLAQGPREDRALVFLMTACALIFVSEWPALARSGGGAPIEARLGAGLFAWLAVMPIGLYGIAALSHLAAKALGGQGSYYGARLALFWALLAVAPLWLLAGAIAATLPGPWVRPLEASALAGLVWLWLPALFAVERGGRDAA
jgi:hypothetical protein